MDYQAIIDEIDAISEEMNRLTKLLDERHSQRNRMFEQAESAVREEYERAEIATAQSISAQVKMGNNMAGM